VDLFDVVRACFRRWYLMVPILLATTWYAHGVYASAKPSYYVNAAVGLAPPSQVQYNQFGAPASRNGLLDVGGASLIANLVVMQMREPSIVNEVVAEGGTPNYGVRMFPVPATSPELPLLLIDTGEGNPDLATKTVDLAVAQADVAARAVQQQAGVPDDQMVRAFAVSSPSKPVAAMPSRTQSTIMIYVAGVGSAVLAAVVVDIALMRRKARRQNRRQIEPQAVDAANSIDAAHPSDDTKKVPSNAQAAEDIRSDSS
jgi:hypothetical protein